MSNNRSDNTERLATAFAALSNPQRLRMFVKLASTCCAPEERLLEPGRGAGFCCAGDVGAGLDLAASTVSHHLKELRQAGLVHVERHGRRIDCRVSQETLELLAAFFARWNPPKRRAGTRDASQASAQRGGTR
jgi:ArsR family transcriptional regulator